MPRADGFWYDETKLPKWAQDKIASLEAQAALVGELVKVCKDALPLLEKIEDANLVGDEGCLWPVELVRAAIAKAEALGVNP